MTQQYTVQTAVRAQQHEVTPQQHDRKRDNWVVSVRGPVGSGKSSFAATSPRKQFWFDLELGAHRAWKMPADSTVWRLPPIAPTLDTLTYAKFERVQGKIGQYRAIGQEFLQAVQSSEYNTIVFDTSKEHWTITHRAFLEEKQDDDEAKGRKPRQELTGIEYAVPNQRMQNFIYLARNFNKNLVLINHERDVYMKRVQADGSMVEVPTGEKELDGFNKTLDLSDWVLATSLEPVNNVLTLRARILKSPVSTALVNMVLDNPTWEMLVGLQQRFSGG